MMPRLDHVLPTMGKELRETLRDRRTLTVMILFPLVIYPLLSLLITQGVAMRLKRQEHQITRVALLGSGPALVELRRLLGQDPTTYAVASTGSPAAVSAGQIDALVQPAQSPTAPSTMNLEILFDGSRDESRQAEERLSALLAQSYPENCSPRLHGEKRDLAPRAQMGGYLLSKALPLVIVLMVLLGAFYPAIDVTAGERERGTLETILSAPIRRFDLLLGKVLAVTVLASLTGMLNLVSMSLTLVQVMRMAAPDQVLPIPWLRAAATCLMMVPAGFLFGALFVAVGSLAKGFKEAQNLLMPVYFLFFAPAAVATVGEFPLRGIATLVPGMNVTLLARDITVGRAEWSSILAVIASTLACGAAAVAFAARFYESESFLDVTAMSPWKRSPWRGAPPALGKVAGPTAGHALVLFSVGYLLLYFVFIPLQQKNLTWGLLVGQWGGLFGVVLVYAWVTHQPISAVLGLRRPPALTLVAAVLIGASAWVVVGLITQWIAPPPTGASDQLRRALLPEDGSRGLPVALLLAALTPAICEEAFFRGPILRGLGSRLSPLAAIALTGLLFGLFHIDLWRLVPTALLGMLLSTLAWRSQSLWPSLVTHGLHNSILLVLASRGWDAVIDRLPPLRQGMVFGSATVVLAAGIALLQRSPAGSKM